MKATPPILLILLTSVALARLGETPEQISARYGQPVQFTNEVAEGVSISTGRYKIEDGVTVCVAFVDRRAVMETISIKLFVTDPWRLHSALDNERDQMERYRSRAQVDTLIDGGSRSLLAYISAQRLVKDMSPAQYFTLSPEMRRAVGALDPRWTSDGMEVNSDPRLGGLASYNRFTIRNDVANSTNWTYIGSGSRTHFFRSSDQSNIVAAFSRDRKDMAVYDSALIR